MHALTNFKFEFKNASGSYFYIVYPLKMPQLSSEDKGKIIGMHASGMSNGQIAEV